MGAADGWVQLEINSGKKFKFGFQTGLRLICSKSSILELEKFKINY
jgi:hypothetical protein